jgi:hypothetical protein
MPKYTLEEIESLIIKTKAEIVSIYEEKPEEKSLIEIDKKLIMAVLVKFETLIALKNLLQNPCL